MPTYFYSTYDCDNLKQLFVIYLKEFVDNSGEALRADAARQKAANAAPARIESIEHV